MSLSQTITEFVRRHGRVRAAFLTGAVAALASTAAFALFDIFIEVDPRGYLFASLFPLCLAPLLSLASFTGYARVIKLQEELKQEVQARRRVEARLVDLASTDSLTGAFNRRYFMERAAQEIDRSRRYGIDLSLLILDLDRLKEINDGYGHLVGDQALMAVVGVCREAIRRQDTLARLGGDEFVILLPETDLVGAAQVGQRIRQGVTQVALTNQGRPVPLSLSLGMAFLADADWSVDELIRQADADLYQAKDAGRQAVACH